MPAAIALDRFDFPGKGVFRKLILLPISLPGIVTGISMLTMFRLFGFNLSLQTVILGHATALLAVVVTQVYARLQRVPKSYAEASSDLGRERPADLSAGDLAEYPFSGDRRGPSQLHTQLR
ncbi:hypothetical protein [uncultured Roseibium sp.]|uniref:ABC transporter permease n=1 Tax=uncultured Roseibium sp. TaxID=1936171 RepID=UPI003217EB08